MESLSIEQILFVIDLLSIYLSIYLLFIYISISIYLLSIYYLSIIIYLLSRTCCLPPTSWKSSRSEMPAVNSWTGKNRRKPYEPLRSRVGGGGYPDFSVSSLAQQRDVLQFYYRKPTLPKLLKLSRQKVRESEDTQKNLLLRRASRLHSLLLEIPSTSKNMDKSSCY